MAKQERTWGTSATRFLVSRIISNSNGNVKQVDDLWEKEAYAEGNSSPSQKKNLSLSKALFNTGLGLFEGEPSASKAHFEDGPLCGSEFWPFFFFFTSSS